MWPFGKKKNAVQPIKAAQPVKKIQPIQAKHTEKKEMSEEQARILAKSLEMYMKEDNQK